MFYKQIANNCIINIGQSQSELSAINGIQEIDETEYNTILELIKNKPTDTAQGIYSLSTDLKFVFIEQTTPFTEEPEIIQYKTGFELGYEQALIDLSEVGDLNV